MKWDNPIFYLMAAAMLVSIGIWVGRMDVLNKTVNKSLRDIKKGIDEILEKLKSSTVEGKSPLRLSEKGQSISETLNASSWAKKKAQEVASHLEGKHPYEIQGFCMNFVRYEFNPTHDFVQKMKSCAYENAIPVSEVEDVLAIELRDALLTILPD